MERFVKGDVVIIPFPFSNLEKTKKRPALIIANLEGNDYILAQITSHLKNDNYSIIISNDDFYSGNLNLLSMLRPNRLFTAEKSLFLYKIGSLKKEKIKEIQDKIIEIFTN
ncbi:MAG: type II toxin-antitoxin system PemK/MazF family toxin [Candidatus Nanoarchaeia archaeon]|nr:type II toxin-antitoxin system PemK/MazF family toxin [Candidatus Nanoarchaeia archaeon]